MRPNRKILWALFLAVPFLFLNAGNAFAVTDDYTPEVTARVARISFVSGDVQIKRADQTVWERAAKNLPIVEGDEITTDADARLEIQFSSESYLRLSENAYLKVTTLRDEGIAVSLPNGSLSARILAFDKERAYFEIDAPQTTVSIERAGMYRVDAGSSRDKQVRVSVTDSGQARVYSENSGFTLRNGRSATVQIDGNYAGEWETADASRYADEFDNWALERDAVIAKRLQRADYDKYYDRDIYGAEDLNEYGEWVFTRKYGYVWKPFRTSISSYANWSPYRYGQWRWVAPYGWTWVNDESWGWATYHHGRWVWDNGGWYWSPYSQYRSRRSWWRPALVVLSYIGNSVCWYPLPYHYGYYDYNRSTYVDRRKYTTIINNTTTVIVNPTPQPNQPTPQQGVTGVDLGGGWGEAANMPPATSVPPTGVIAVDISGFGTGTSGFNAAPVTIAKQVLSKTPTQTTKPPVLPTYKDLSGKVSREIVVENPVKVKVPAQTKIGASERTSGVALGETLRKDRFEGNRSPIEKNDRTTTDGGIETAPIRTTGAVKRESRENSPSNNQNPTKRSTRSEALPNDEPVRSSGGRKREENPPAVKPRNDNQEITPDYTPPRREEPRRREEREEPVRNQPPPRSDPPPTKREESKPPTPKSEPPPRKQEPAPEKKPAPTEVKGDG